MVKREKVIPGVGVQVSKKTPGSPGPKFQGTLGVNERLQILSVPYCEGGMNLVRVQREKTGETIEVMYAFLTSYCRLESTKRKRSRVKKTPSTIVPSRE